MEWDSSDTIMLPGTNNTRILRSRFPSGQNPIRSFVV